MPSTNAPQRADTALGAIHTLATARGLVALTFAPHAPSAPRGAALLHADDERLADWTRRAAAAIDRPGDPLPPLDLDGTSFQRAVWEALLALPVGRPTTYAALAVGLGRPTAARAVARACADNRIAVLVPCHRVVPSAGGLGGYRWGVARKQLLLAREQAIAPDLFHASAHPA